MKPSCYLFVAAVATLLLGCSPAAAPSSKPATAVPPQPTTTSPAAAAAPRAPAPASTPAVAAKDAAWEQTLAAARAEGKVVVGGGAPPPYRAALSEFQKDYPGIEFEFTGLTGPEFWARVIQERAAGQYLWDIRTGGIDTTVYQNQSTMLEPIRPLLALPEVLDDSKWFGGVDGIFADDGKRCCVAFFGSVGTSLYVNRDFVSEAELPSTAQLLDPRLKGKIAMGDPRGGPGLGQLTALYAAHGEDFLTALLTQQEIVSTIDIRQLTEWVVRGRYPVGVGLPIDELVRFTQEGMAGNVKPLKGAETITAGGGGVMVLKNAPHPNAARVFVNWVLTRRAQELLSKAAGYNSLRLDVAPVDPAGVIDPASMGQYIFQASEKNEPNRARAREIGARLVP